MVCHDLETGISFNYEKLQLHFTGPFGVAGHEWVYVNILVNGSLLGCSYLLSKCDFQHDSHVAVMTLAITRPDTITT